MNPKFKDYLTPLFNGLTGRPGAFRAETRHYAVRPVGLIVGDLCRIPDRDWGSYAFSREPLGGRFTDEQRMELTDRAIACGTETARKCIEQYGTRDAGEMAAHMGLRVDFPRIPQGTSRVLFAEFHVPDQIHVFMDGVEKAEAMRSEPGVAQALTDELDTSKLLISHELFHFVEEQHDREIWTRTYRVDLWGAKFLHNRSRVGVLGEIAAMAFAKELNRLPYSPYVMDAFLVYGYSPEAASGLYEEMMRRAGLTPRPAETEQPRKDEEK